MGKNNVTAMIVKENKYGDIEFLENMVFHPTANNYKYKFQLHKLQNDLEDLTLPEIPDENSSTTREEWESAMDYYDKEKSFALKEGYSTSYSILLLIEGTPEELERVKQIDPE